MSSASLLRVSGGKGTVASKPRLPGCIDNAPPRGRTSSRLSRGALGGNDAAVATSCPARGPASGAPAPAGVGVVRGPAAAPGGAAACGFAVVAPVGLAGAAAAGGVGRSGDADGLLAVAVAVTAGGAGSGSGRAVGAAGVVAAGVRSACGGVTAWLGEGTA